MELKYILIALLKILNSTPTIFLLHSLPGTKSAALMGGHLDNKSNSTNGTDTYYQYDMLDRQELEEKQVSHNSQKENTDSEEIPNPSPLVLPGYNLPENIFNHGKPFYVEKDPVTGEIDFDHKSPSLKLEPDLYEYVDSNIYDKANIDRKDGDLSSHKLSDVNQLTPNFHDFLNLPVKYNPDKYVYPLISNSYASTKVQGSVNKFHNHKDYALKFTTKKPLVSPTYYPTSSIYFNPTKSTSKTTTTVTTTTTQKPSTIKKYPEIYLTTKPANLMDTEMSHPNFSEEYDYDDPNPTTEKLEPSNIYLTTQKINNIYLTSKVPTTTTKKPMSLFEQLFGDYAETVTTTENTKTSTAFSKLSHNDYSKNKYEYETKTEKTSYATPTSITNSVYYPNAHAGSNVPTASSMGLEPNYDYEDYNNEKYEDNVAVENRPVKNLDDELKIEPLNIIGDKEKIVNKIEINNNSHLPVTNSKLQNNDYSEYDYQEKATTTTTTTTTTTSTTISSTTPPTTTTSKPTSMITPRPTTGTTPIRITSLPLGENHIVNSIDSFNREPIIVATQNLKEKLNSEKVLPKPFEQPVVHHTQHPSISNIHIAPDQDTISFIVGNQQNVDDGQYVGTSLKEDKEHPHESNPFRPLYDQEAAYAEKDSVSYSVQVEPTGTLQLQSSPPLLSQHYPEAVGSAATIQPIKKSEASVAIGVPATNSMKQVPVQVADEVDIENTSIQFPKSNGSKIIFPNEKESEFPDLVPPPRPIQPIRFSPPNREILKLNSKLVYHQLSSDLTPPKEKENIPPPRTDHRLVRPPWDPRPGHFYSDKPEYNRPPRIPPEISYKRIDNLPNILPQFRPNMKHNGPVGPYYNRLVRQPLLERLPNRPIGFFEKLQPPPPSFSNLKNLQHLRKIPSPNTPPRQSLDETQIAEDRIITEGARRPIQAQEQYGLYQTPPPIKIANRRKIDDAAEVETLQMIQAKNAEKAEKAEKSNKEHPFTVSQIVNIPAKDNFEANTEKTIYKVYPVNTPPIKMDVIDSSSKESVVIGTRAELPLPPSKINKDFVYDALFDSKDRNDDPVLKPHPRPPAFPTKSDFPYRLERPELSSTHSAVPETPLNNRNDIDEVPNSKLAELSYVSNNQWDTIGENLESRITNKQKVNSSNLNQISVTLKTYTEKPIAIAYTPTEPNLNAHKYSMANYGKPVIPEILPATAENAVKVGQANSDDEFTVSAIMHTHPQLGLGIVKNTPKETHHRTDSNHKSDIDAPDYLKLDFQAPFQASVNLDHSINQGWSVVGDKNKTSPEIVEPTTLPYATTSEFDIENFKPQLEGGFKPIYDFPDGEKIISGGEEREKRG